MTAAGEEEWAAKRPLAGLSVWLPGARADAGEEPAARVLYNLLDLPFSPRFLDDPTDEPGAWELARWLRESEPVRASYIIEVLGRLGAPVGGLPGGPDRLVDLSGWAARWLSDAFRRDVPRLSWPPTQEGIARFLVTPRAPSKVVSAQGDWDAALSLAARSGYREPEELVELSLSYDLAMLVVACARRARPDLEWAPRPKPDGLRLRRTEHWPWFPIFNPSEPGWSPTLRSHWFVASSTSHPERWSEDNLYTIYQHLVTTEPSWELPEESPPVPLPGYSCDLVRLIDAGPEDPAPSPAVLEAVRAFRLAGWFQSERARSDASLAAALAATYRKEWGWGLDERFGHESQVDERLVALDGERSITLDSEANPLPGNTVYASVLSVLADISGGAYVIDHLDEDWGTLAPEEIVVSFALNGERHEFSLLDTGVWLNPSVFTELNALLPAFGPRYWFVDTGGQDGVVTRATNTERQALQTLRPISLSPEPPGWWRESGV